MFLTTIFQSGKATVRSSSCASFAGAVLHSFGIHVARLAGMPDDVVKRAEARLAELEAESGNGSAATFSRKPKKSARPTPDKGVQLTLYQLDDPLLLEIKEELQNIDINQMSPLDAFDTIRRLKKKIGL